MMKKADLVKLITKKAGISDSSAKEFFDVFLRKIAEELEPGESARFSNLGYFHFRRGEIKKQDDLNEAKKVDYLDLIIFSPSSQLNIKSHDNVVFSVSEMHEGEQDALDAHFSLSIGKPVLPQLEGNEMKEDEDHHTEENYLEFERKARSLMANLHPDESIKSKGEILLVDIRSIDSDQFELELTDEAKKKNAVKKSEASIHSSEKLKSKAWDFGNILSKQIEKNQVEKENVESNQEQQRSDDAKWDFGKRYWDSTPASKPVSENNQNSLKPVNPKEPKNELDNIDDEDLGDELFDLENDIPDIAMDDFAIPDEEDKMGKFERVRSIRSSLQDLPDEEKNNKTNKFLNPEYDSDDSETEEMLDKFRNKIGDLNPAEEKEKITEEVTEIGEHEPVVEKKTGTEIKLNRRERKKEHQKYERRNTGSSFLKILAVLIIIIGGLYLLFKENGNGNVTEVTPRVGKNDNTTYVERSYDIPVTYPYDKKENGQDISGIDLSKEKEKETIPEKGVTKNTTPPVNIKNESSRNQEPILSNAVNNTSNTSNDPVLITANIYNYGSYFIVQVSAFRSEQVAENTAAKYNSLGFKAFIETIQINGNDWYRVRVGNFKTLEEAQNFNNSKN